MENRIVLPLLTVLSLMPASPADLSVLPYRPIENWAKLPEGWLLGECSGVALDSHDNVWVFNRGAHPVIQFDPNGKVLRAWSELPVKSSHGIRIDAEDNVWLVDVAGHKILKMSPEGRLLMIMGASGGAAGNQESTEAYNRPTNVGFGKDGSFFITDGYVNSRVLHYNKNGDFLNKWGSKGTGDSQFNIVHDIVIDGSGRLYVADRENGRIQIFTPDGKLVGKWENLGAAWGLTWVEREKAIYMTDGVQDRVIKLNMNGQIVGTFGSHGKAPGRLDYPHSIAVDRSGAIYVAEIRNWRVQKFVKQEAH